MLRCDPRAQVSTILARIATWASILRDHLGPEFLHRRQMLTRGRRRPDNDSRDAHLRKFPDVTRLERLAQPADRDLQRRAALRRALMLAQTLDRRRDLVVGLRDSVPSVAEFRRALERRLGVAAEHDRRMRLLQRFRHELEPRDADRLAVILRRVPGPQLF